MVNPWYSHSGLYLQNLLLLLLLLVLLLTFYNNCDAERLLYGAWLMTECFLFFLFCFSRPLASIFNYKKKFYVSFSYQCWQWIKSVFPTPCIYSDFASRWKISGRWVIIGRGQQNSHSEVPLHPVMLTMWESVCTELTFWLLSAEKWYQWAPHFFNEDGKFLLCAQTWVSVNDYAFWLCVYDLLVNIHTYIYKLSCGGKYTSKILLALDTETIKRKIMM